MHCAVRSVTIVMCVHCAVGWWQCLLIMRDPLRPNQCLSWGSSPSLSLTRLFYFILTHRKRLTWPCIDGHNQLQEIWLVLLCSFGSWGGGSSQFRKSTGNVSEILRHRRGNPRAMAALICGWEQPALGWDFSIQTGRVIFYVDEAVWLCLAGLSPLMGQWW